MKQIEKKDYSKMWDFHQVENRKGFIGGHGRQKELMKFIKRLALKKGGKILDIGFGDGKLLEILFQEGYQSYGVDFSESNINFTKKLFKERGESIQLEIGDISRIPFQDKFFDVIIASEILEHLNDQILKMGLNELFRVLKENGTLLATVPYQENLEPEKTSCPNCGAVFHRWGHEQSFNEEKLKKLLSGAGFTKNNVSGKNFTDSNLNIFGKLESVAKKMLGQYKNYLIIAKK